MTTFAQRLRLAVLTAIGLGTTGFWFTAAQATTFSNRPLPPDRVVAIASPVGTSSHQLLILEQLTNQRQCWRTTGNTVDPLLLEFDFTDICGRGTDSNGYSLRVGGEDLGWRYSLRIERNRDTLRLLAVSNTNRTSPPLEVGTARATSGDFVEIELNPGWEITKRVYNGQPLGHYYLTNTQSLDSLIAAAPSPQPELPPITTVRPSDPAPQNPTSPTLPTVPSRPAPPTPVSPHNFEGTPPPPSEYAARLGLNYRVIVPAPTLDIQERIRSVVPDAFRMVVDGELVMQAGAFRDRIEAEVLKQRLRIYNLEADILEVADRGGSGVEPGQGGDRPMPPAPPPTAPPRPPSNPGGLPSVPEGRYVVVIDPGHGGRDPGAIGIGGLRETDVVMDISRQVNALLQQQGVQVVMTRTGEQFIDLAPRVSIAERANADIFVSIHANAISMSRPEVNGAETYYYASREGYQLASQIQQRMVRDLNMRDRGVKEARFYVIRNTSMPAALVEVGFVTGAQDAPRLNDADFRSRMAEAIAAGILDYLQ